MLVPELKLATHDGGTYGFSSSLGLNLGEQRGALVLANAAVMVNDLARHLLNPSQPLRNVAAEKQRRSPPSSSRHGRWRPRPWPRWPLFMC
ncbi:MAG: hypothetical protein ACK5QH_04895 [Rubrivivax sp.]|jgi:hypothetical protein